MSTKRYCVFMIPAEHRPAANLLMAVVNGDNPNWSNSFSVKANPTGNHEDPTTHFYGGMSVTEEWLAQVSNLNTDMVPLPEGTTWADFDTTEAEAVAAAEAMHLQLTITQDGSEPSSIGTLHNALAALGLQMVQEPT